jgi:cytosine/uracil/thiamine/allantoin permease
LYSYAWFTSFGVSFVMYLGLMKTFGRRYLQQSA